MVSFIIVNSLFVPVRYTDLDGFTFLLCKDNEKDVLDQSQGLPPVLVLAPCFRKLSGSLAGSHIKVIQFPLLYMLRNALRFGMYFSDKAE